MRAHDLVFLIDFVRTHTGIQLDVTKSYLLESRLNPVLREEELETMGALCNALRGSDAKRLLPKIVDAMTTNETSFFRDDSSFQHLGDEVMPRLMDERRGSKKLRIWSAACSSGQEAVTIAILMAERFPELSGWDVEILASDVSAKMVERCSSLTFTHGEVARGMPVDLRDKHFRPVEGGWQASAEIRSRVNTRQINLIEPFSMVEQQDLILLRNVLIYFDEPTRESILADVHRVLAPDGFLLLGTAEKPRSVSYQRAFGAQANVFRRAS